MPKTSTLLSGLAQMTFELWAAAPHHSAEAEELKAAAQAMFNALRAIREMEKAA